MAVAFVCREFLGAEIKGSRIVGVRSRSLKPHAWRLLTCDLGPLAQAGQEREGGLGRGGGFKRGADWLNVSIELERTFAVHLYNRAIKFEAGKHAACAGIAQHF